MATYWSKPPGTGAINVTINFLFKPQILQTQKQYHFCSDVCFSKKHGSIPSSFFCNWLTLNHNQPNSYAFMFFVTLNNLGCVIKGLEVNLNFNFLLLWHSIDSNFIKSLLLTTNIRSEKLSVIFLYDAAPPLSFHALERDSDSECRNCDIVLDLDWSSYQCSLSNLRCTICTCHNEGSGAVVYCT